MSECRHGLKLGCSYCHGSTTAVTGQPRQKRRTAASRLADKMNDRMAELKRRLQKLRGQ